MPYKPNGCSATGGLCPWNEPGGKHTLEGRKIMQAEVHTEQQRGAEAGSGPGLVPTVLAGRAGEGGCRREVSSRNEGRLLEAL